MAKKKKLKITLEDDQAALVVSGEDVQLFVPKQGEHEFVSTHVMLITAIAIMLSDGDDELAKVLHRKLNDLQSEVMPKYVM